MMEVKKYEFGSKVNKVSFYLNIENVIWKTGLETIFAAKYEITASYVTTIFFPQNILSLCNNLK